MCKKRNSVMGFVANESLTKLKNVRMDPCIKDCILSLSMRGYKTVACCCGHGRYPVTIVCKVADKDRFFELISGKDIPRTRNFYRKDAAGFYYIPETIMVKDLWPKK